jgi:L-arabinose isomerase
MGNTNSRYRFSPGARGFAWNKQWPAHHCAVGIGRHLGSRLEKRVKLLGIDVVRVC